MKIRAIKESDHEVISKLLGQLGYPDTEKFIQNKIRALLLNSNEYLVVIEDDEQQVFGFISIHIIPQIALEEDFARISYFSVDENYRSMGAGKMLEEYCVQVATERNCDRIELHCHSRREKAHLFYYRQGYEESPKYLMKKL
ncbi:TPA: GNAT family N-acetyltransferase [Elizabethkingia anophelis]|uniref:GNAT family N-acetyltransferase n=1 Tax=Elizabethkingia anophelis TaxID=1117645 RepID=UPI00136B756B|nr:GNAT family N-acetyltransferase [Elizabethkingia anophelis]MCT3703213.1 GNAT family N-acetyltransferase [Elizabethkingia anophelis]MCT3962593.1 GNAT family N-acetyltransferase [Elizabethkingia anophelis]MCT4212031.1 GNAT family N-acetyltransferase [Elizabethkingia anophelis]MDV3602721.1 GNAT family N-acetyltransferase [Elizabethkingia anophelis]MDV3859751.1 GNAT family N-acetyltransferase [Elizabethkingia anophelis]